MHKLTLNSYQLGIALFTIVQSQARKCICGVYRFARWSFWLSQRWASWLAWMRWLVYKVESLFKRWKRLTNRIQHFVEVWQTWSFAFDASCQLAFLSPNSYSGLYLDVRHRWNQKKMMMESKNVDYKMGYIF